ncbi:hypothetical protein I7I53_08442 [Histoplasma capsulatum var. duboisii H88]|uniref:Uncharacterized protein n=1 Tax=Ajellomyces capsulatus (strain H88) TaxID=544711 RepID=A0A8A1LJT6_AJEC8|nr:hypothetical protein I7I53_08442 [Histoplasma capsulatum var. duboisii H88]
MSIMKFFGTTPESADLHSRASNLHFEEGKHHEYLGRNSKALTLSFQEICLRYSAKMWTQ